ncbi:MAG TPA: AraC family transcriptional regulator [Puia sp.]|nr:AraC family transcriptional regulator [Puia sp.]
MAGKPIPVYDIDNFTYWGTESSFYANAFPDHLKQHAHLILAPHRHVFYVTVLFTKGSGSHEIDFNTYEIVPGSVFMLSPGQVHTWKLSKDIDGYIVFHDKEFYNLNFTHDKVENYPFFSSTENRPLTILKDREISSIELDFRAIVGEYQNRQLMAFQKICSLLTVLYIDLSRAYLPVAQRAKQNETQLAQVRRLEILVENHFRSTKSAGQYARMMFTGEKNLNRICKITLNKTTSEVIADRIILEAKRMLVHSKFSVIQIAAELGYLDDSYFVRVFKKRTGETPLQFLRRYQTKNH